MRRPMLQEMDRGAAAMASQEASPTGARTAVGACRRAFSQSDGALWYLAWGTRVTSTRSSPNHNGRKTARSLLGSLGTCLAMVKVRGRTSRQDP